MTNANAGTYTFGYDDLNRLKTAVLTGASTANYTYTYSYNELGNLMSRTGTDPDMTYTYGAGSAGPQAVTSVAQNGDDDLAFSYGVRGNMATRSRNDAITHNYAFDVEGRLTSVTMGTQKTTFAYDADGQRVLAVYNSGTTQETRVYTPFPDYEMEDPPAGDNITRTTYRLAGQMVAVQKRVGTGAGTFAYTYSDHLGNLVGLSSLTGVLDAASLARYDPFGNFRTTPATNPGTTNHGFTGHRHNNTGTNNLGLIYMNARYYLPEVGRFVSPDTIVPEPGEPQSYNRYSYVRNSPLNFTDPTGHRECLDSDANGCTIITPYEPSSKPPPKPPSPPPFDPKAQPFIILPFDGLDVTKGLSMQGFGDTTIAYEHREDWYQIGGRLHSGWDIPMPTGTSLRALGQGKVICADAACGLSEGSGGLGIAVYYELCSCVVFYLHVSSVVVAEGDLVSLRMRIGSSGASSTGFEHLHLEIRPRREALTFYNPLYFFTSAALGTITNRFTDYQNGSNEWRIYAYTSSDQEGVYGSYWNDTLPELWIQH